MYRILVVGSGYAGTAVAKYFRSKNQKVWAMTRSDLKAKELEQIGIQPVVCDLTKPETLKEIPYAQFVVISVAPNSRDEDSYRSVYLDGVRNFLEHLKQGQGPLLAVYFSSTGVYRDCAGEWVDESVVPEPDSERSKILLQAEEQVLTSGLPSIIFRLGGIYGPGRNHIQNLKSGKWPEPADDQYVNLIHLDDVVDAIPVLLKSAEVGNVYIGVDDEPVKRSELFAWLSGELKIKNGSKFDSVKSAGGKRCRNLKLKNLGFQFQFPNFKAGYESLIGDGPVGDRPLGQ